MALTTAMQPWKISHEGGLVQIDFGNGLTQSYPVSKALQFFSQGIAACTSQSQVATAPAGRGRPVGSGSGTTAKTRHTVKRRKTAR
jgi:hypothetical protein